MKNINLNSMSIEELWTLHQEVASILSAKLQAEKLKFEKRLEQLETRRPYPKVYPRFRNPEPPHQTWSGRGLEPQWVRKLLAAGKKLEELRISNGRVLAKAKSPMIPA
jgi:DNA-binding protein H-NS